MTAAAPVAASGAGSAAIPSYCLVSGRIKPVDPSAPDILFQLALPDAWNNKVVMLGGSGFDGSIPSPITASSIFGNSPTAVLPLSRGYAVFASDSGHQSGSLSAAFALNTEAYKNYIGDAIKKTRDVSISLVSSHYGAMPARSYFWGYSRGGGEALAAVQRWPSDWDGAIAGAPAWNITQLLVNGLQATQAFAAPGAWLDAGKRGALYSAALQACDGLDGAMDGVISNTRACADAFSPSTATLNGIPLRCVGGADTGDSCLSDAQIAALASVNAPTSVNYTFGIGDSTVPGYPVYTADNGLPINTPSEQAITAYGAIGLAPPTYPVTASMTVLLQFANSFFSYALAGEATFNPFELNVVTGSGLSTRIEYLSSLDANITNLSPFMSKGSKLMMWVGTADMLVGTRGTENYYNRLVSTMGAAQVDSFVRFYELPGAQHGPSTVFQASWDQLTSLENWVEKGIDPSNNLVSSDDVGVPGRTRPMCTYPGWPKYGGTGDINSATSFSCTLN